MQYSDSIVNKFWVRVDTSGECWLWVKHLNQSGYGKFSFIANKRTVTKRAHRFSYELHKGKIPMDKEIDHMCRNRACVNPDHLEVVSHKENCIRGFGDGSPRTHCKHGHECGLQYNYGKRQRTCKTCVHLRQAEYRAKNWVPPQPRTPKTHCKRGHEFSGTNLYINSLDFKECNTCRREAKLRYYYKQKVMA